MVKSIIRSALLAAALGFAAVPAIADDLPADGSTDTEAGTDLSWTTDEESSSYSEDFSSDEAGGDGSCYGDTDVTRC